MKNLKKVFSVIILFALLFSMIILSTAAESYEDVFEKDVIEIKIEIDPDDYQNMLDNSTLEEYKSANVTIDGITVENVGIRTKGNSTLSNIARSDSDRYSFRIKFNKYVNGQKFLGLDDLVLNNNYSDPSYMREYLSYEAMREAGMAAPLATYASIYINGELKGFYICVEMIENSFLKRNFDNKDGNLYKQEQGSSLVYKENDEYQSSELKVGSDTEKTGLKNMIDILNNSPERIEEVLDVDSALKYIAANTVLGSYDSYSGSFAHNYYIYENEGKFHIIPWDYNMSFGGFGQGGSGTSTGIDQPVSGSSIESRPLINNLLPVDEYKEKYYGYVQDFMDYLENFEDRVTELAKVIRPYVEEDPTKFVTMEQFENNIKYVEQQENTMEMPGFEVFERNNDGQQRQRGMQGGQQGQRAERPQMPTDGQQPNQSDNQRGNMGGGFGQGRQGGMTPPMGEMPEGFTMPENFTPPEGFTMPEGAERGGRGGMGMGGGSIVTYAVNRLENLEKQFSGEAEKTTAMTNIGRGGMGMGGVFGQQGSQNSIKVTLNNNPLSLDTSPVIEDGRTLVPLRAIFEALNMTVDYNDETREILAQGNGLEIKMTVGETIVYKNGEAVELEVPSRIVNERTLVPVRFVAESAGLTVDYDEAAKTVIITE